MKQDQISIIKKLSSVIGLLIMETFVKVMLIQNALISLKELKLLLAIDL